MAPEGDDVTLGEVNRNVKDMRQEFRDGIRDIRETTVSREVYTIDRDNINGRLDAIEEDQKVAIKNRRQTVIWVASSVIASATAIVTTLIEVRAHP